MRGGNERASMIILSVLRFHFHTWSHRNSAFQALTNRLLHAVVPPVWKGATVCLIDLEAEMLTVKLLMLLVYVRLSSFFSESIFYIHRHEGHQDTWNIRRYLREMAVVHCQCNAL